MKNILTLTAIAIVATFSASAQSNFSFVSKQHQQVKFDTSYNAYFIDTEVNSTSKIRVKDQAVYFMSTDGTAVSTSKVQLGTAELEAINTGNSFSLNGVKDNNGNIVKVSFWFIDGVLDEVSYTNESTKVTTAYKNFVNPTEENTSKALALNRRKK